RAAVLVSGAGLASGAGLVSGAGPAVSAGLAGGAGLAVGAGIERSDGGSASGAWPENGVPASGAGPAAVPLGGLSRSDPGAASAGLRRAPGTSPGTSPGGAHAAVTEPRRLLTPRSVAAVAGLAVILAVAAGFGARLLSHAGSASAAPGTGVSNAPGVFGIPTVTSGCPAASVRGSGARCPKVPECWNGLVVISGSATASPLPCGRPHVWETFAIAILPADVRTYDQNMVAANPAVSAVCSMQVLLRSRQGRARQIPAGSWEIDVLPPDEAAFDSGDRAYRCLAHRLTGRDPRTPDFGR
ncbi:MAG TPA: hypothetical protein VN840_22245, partial [Streptosporangiaceae bacterium]|nr:hypothetical protein [Streptosporangiaceae bacterium]